MVSNKGDNAKGPSGRLPGTKRPDLLPKDRELTVDMLSHLEMT